MGRIKAFNDWLAQRITAVVATMWCAYAFAILALISLPGVLGFNWLPDRTVMVVAWIAQTFLQLVLLSVIMVGQSLQAQSTHQVIADHHDIIVGHHERLAAHLGVPNE